jgi:hypothetical protein
MEASMHGKFNRSDGTDKSSAGYSSIRLVVIPALLAVALVALAIKQPDVSRWISDTVQAEFANTGTRPDTAATQVAQPARQIRTVKAN